MKIKPRTIYTPNEIEILETHALMCLYNKACNIKAKTLIDLDDVAKISKHKWRFGNGIYVDNPKIGYLHRFVINAKVGEEVDHINRNKLDNRKENLRLCKHIDNCANRGIIKNNKSGAKGVCWKKREQKFEAYINVNCKYKSLGYFDNVVSAAKAYNEAALKYFGEFAVLNEISTLIQ